MVKIFQLKTIKYKLILVITLVSVLALSLGSTVILINNIVGFRETLRSRVELNTGLVSEYLITPLAFDDQPGAEKILTELQQLPYVQTAVLVTTGGNVFARFDRSGTPALPALNDLKPANGFNGGFLHFSQTITHDGYDYGAIYIRASLDELNANIWHDVLTMALLLVGLLLVTFFLAARFQGIISKPILALANAANQVAADSDYSLRVKKETGDEVGTLYDSFNDMLEQIQVREQERTIAEAALKEKTDLVDKIIESSALSTWISDEKGTAIRVNAACLEFFGATKEEVIGKYNLLQDEVLEKQGFMPDIRDVIEKGQIANIVIDYDFGGVQHIDIAKPNHKIINSIFTPILDDAGNVSNIIVQSIDLTEIKQAEQQLRESEKRLREAQEMAHLGFWSWDVKTGVVDWSDEVFKIFGLNPEAFTPQIDSILALSPWPEDHSRNQELINRAMKDHNPGSYEQKFLRPDQSIGYYYSTFQGIYDEKDELVSFVGTVLDITERKQSEEILKKSEEKFRGIYEQSPIAIEIYSKDGKLIDANQQTLDMFGVEDKKYVLGFDLWSDPNLSDEKMKLLKGGQAIFISTEFDFEKVKKQTLYPTTKSGIMYMDMYAIPLMVENLITGYLIQIIDVTESKQTQKTLKQRNEYIESVMENMPIGFALNSINDGDVKYMNNNFEEIYGWSRDILTNTSIFFEKVLPGPEYRKKMQANIIADMESGDPKRMNWKDLKIVTSSGDVRYVHAYNIPLIEQNLMISTVQDNTDRKIAEDALIKSEEKFRSVFENSPLGKSMTGIDGSLKVNKAFCDILGYSEDELKTKKWQELTHPDDIQENKAVVQSLLNGEKSSARYEKRYLHKNGNIVWTDVNTAIQRDVDGTPLFFITTINNITERKWAEAEIRKLNENLEERVVERTAELESVNKELEAFAYSVSHDLRAPLRHISGFSEILVRQIQQKPDERDSIYAYLGKILGATKQMGILIDDLLAFSRLGRQALQKSTVDLNALIDTVRSELLTDLTDRKIDWTIKPLPTIFADQALMRQVFMNLLSNAIKYTGPRKIACIEIGSELKADQVVIYVKDNGVGFDMNYVGKLFGVFQRLHSKNEFEGTGIGLAIVQRLVIRHGGRVWAEAVLDEGATFYLALPRAKRGTNHD